MFDGHQFYILDQCWVYDLTDGIGYRVQLDKHGNVVQYTRQFTLFADQSQPEYVQDVPQEIIDESLRIINAHKKLALVQ